MVRIVSGSITGWQTWDYVASPTTVGEWVHIAMVHSNGVLRAYKNGVEVASVLSGTTQQPNTGAPPVLYIGGIIITSSRYYPLEGQLDEVPSLNVARSAARDPGEHAARAGWRRIRAGSLLPYVGRCWYDTDG